MFSYLVLSGEPSKVEEIFTRINKLISDQKSTTKNWLSDTFFVNTQFGISKMSSQRLWAYFAFSDNKKDLERFVKQNNRGLCIINSSETNVDASDCLDWLSSHSIDDVPGKYDGGFSCVSITRKNGFSSFNDFSGNVPVFYASKQGVNLVSNVPKLISYVVNDSSDYDYLSLSWLITTGIIYFDKSLYCNVNKLNPLKYIKAEIGGTSAFTLVPFKNTIFTQSNDLCSDLTNAEWDRIYNKLIKNTENYLGRLPDKRISISGDKDSRLLLALALSSSYKNEIEVFSDSTNHDYLADFCSAVGIKKFSSTPAEISNEQEDNSSDLLGTCQQFMKSYNQRSSLLSKTDNCFLSSLGGGLYRGTWWNQQFAESDFDNGGNKLYMKFINYSQSFDKSLLLSDYYRLAQIDQVSCWVTENLEHANNFLPEKFYLQNILGNSCFINPFRSENYVFPLLSFEVAKLYCKLSMAARSKELLHFNCMYRSDPKLCEYPFRNESWKQGLNGYKGINLKLANTLHKERSTVQMPLLKYISNNKEQAIQVFDDAQRSTDIDSIISIDKLKNQLMSIRDDSSKVDILSILRGVAICAMLGKSK